MSAEETPMAPNLSMWTDDEETIIARDLDDVRAVYREIGCGDMDVDDYYAIDEDYRFSFRHESGEVETKPVREWIAEQGRGYFASTNC